MIRADRKNTLILLLLSLAILLVLAASLPGLHFQPGQPFSLEGKLPPPPGASQELSGGEALIWLLRGIMALAIILLPVYIILNLLTPEGRKNLLANSIMLVVLYILASLLSDRSLQNSSNATSAPAALPPPAFPEAGPLVQFTPGAPSWLDILLIVVLAVLAAGLTAYALHLFRAHQSAPASAPADLSQPVEEALHAIRSGGDLQDIVIRSYLQMSQILSEEGGIQRERAMTPLEFQNVLEQKGFPRGPVHELTHLFEEVRYGHHSALRGEERRAVACLSAIADHCRSMQVGKRDV